MILGHVKWFTTVEPIRNSIKAIFTPSTVFYILLSMIFIFLLYFFTPYLLKLNFLNGRYIQSINKETFFRFGIALSLVISAINGHVLTPDIHSSSLTFWAMILSATGLIIKNKYTQWFSLLLILTLFISNTFILGIHNALDYLFYVGVIVTLIAILLKKDSLKARPLEILTGISLLWVAAEKIIYSNMSLDIVEHYSIFTFGFSQAHFVFCIALVEMVIGFVLITGYYRKIISFVLTIVFLGTNLIFGSSEIMAHMPLHIIFIFLILHPAIIKYNPRNFIRALIMTTAYLLLAAFVVFIY